MSIFIYLLFIIALVEFVFSELWNRYYFLYGFYIFNKTFEYSNSDFTLNNINNFINFMDKTESVAHYKGKCFDENTFFFRKKFFSFGFFRNDFENLHGIISIDTENRVVKLKCNTCYNYLLLTTYMFPIFFQQSQNVLTVLLTAFIVFSMFFFSGLFRYKKLAKEISKLVH